MKKIVLASFLSLGVWLLASAPAMAVHKGAGDLTCGTCHTMHMSQGNLGLGGNENGSLVLLRGAVTNRAEIHKFCLQCHASDGAQHNATFQPHSESAPKVLLPDNAWNEDTLLHKIGAGGDFNMELGTGQGDWDRLNGVTGQSNIKGLGYGHSLGMEGVTPPGATGTDGDITSFTCTSCHDPHGTSDEFSGTINKFRNLRMIPTDSGSVSVELNDDDHTSWIGGITGLADPGPGNYEAVDQASGAVSTSVTTLAIWPAYSGTITGVLADDAAHSNAYGGGVDGMSAWCATCHDKWHEGIGAGSTNIEGSDWRRHPVDTVLDQAGALGLSGAGVEIYDMTWYDGELAGNQLPVASAQNSNRVFYTTATNAETDTIMCLSCHFAHGGPYFDNLRWDYLNTVEEAGVQNGNGVPTGGIAARGCQLCHNR